MCPKHLYKDLTLPSAIEVLRRDLAEHSPIALGIPAQAGSEWAHLLSCLG